MGKNLTLSLYAESSKVFDSQIKEYSNL